MHYHIKESIQTLIKNWYENFETVAFDVDEEVSNDVKDALATAANKGFIDSAMVESLYMLALDNTLSQEDAAIAQEAQTVVRYFNEELLPFVQKESL